jgi:hypothetical protein
MPGTRLAMENVKTRYRSLFSMLDLLPPSRLVLEVDGF